MLHECDSEDERDGSEEESYEAKEIVTKRNKNADKGMSTNRSDAIFQTFGNQSSGKNTGRLSQNEYLQN